MSVIVSAWVRGGVTRLIPAIPAIAVAILFSPLSVIAAERQVPASHGELELSFAPVVKKAAPAVVNIYAQKVIRNRATLPFFDDPFFQRFFGPEFNFGGPRQQRQNSLGSGVIVRTDGLIVTNKHVIEGADQINVVLADRREFAARIVVTDERTDLAVLRVETGGEPLPALGLRDSDDLQVGDMVLAIGNPFGVGQTVTSGIVSALARSGVTSSDLNSFIQTDAAINPGNSGGALVAMDGRLVGVNTAIFSKSGGSLGIGFAVPSNMVRAVINGVTRDGRLVRPWLGASGQAVAQDVANSLGMKQPAGVLISNVHKVSAAADAGLKVGDVVLAVNGHPVEDPNALNYRIATLRVGDMTVLRIWRRNQTVALKVALAPPAEYPPRDVSDLSGPHPISGAKVANLSPALADELNIDPFLEGVMVVGVKRGSASNRLGFQAGDLVRTVNDAEVENVRQLKNLLERRADRWQITIERGGKTMKLIING